MDEKRGLARINTMLGDKFYRIRDSKCVLVRLFRNVLFQRNIGIADWSKLMDVYAAKPKNKIRKGDVDSSSDKSNLTKALGSNEMSWKSFQRAMNFLDIRSYKITLTITDRSGVVTTHEQTVEVNNDNVNSFIKSENIDEQEETDGDI